MTITDFALPKLDGHFATHPSPAGVDPGQSVHCQMAYELLSIRDKVLSFESPKTLFYEFRSNVIANL